MADLESYFFLTQKVVKFSLAFIEKKEQETRPIFSASLFNTQNTKAEPRWTKAERTILFW